MSQPNPHDELYPEWCRYKKGRASAQRELHRSYEYESTVIQSYRQSQAVEWSHEASALWEAALDRVLGPGWRIEWQGTTRDPMCVVNGAMFFT